MPRLQHDPVPQEIVRLYRAGGSLPKVSAMVRLPVGKVREILVEAGVPIRSRGAITGASHNGKLTVQQREQLRADLRSGKFPTMVSIARKYGVCRECVRQNAAIVGITRYTKKSLAEAGRKRETLRRAARAAALAERKAADEKRRKLLAELWQGGVSSLEIGRILGFKNRYDVAHLVSFYRRRFPADFPNRIARKAPPKEVKERARARAARVAARREQTEKRHALLVGLWKTGATQAEIASAFGLNIDAIKTAIRRHRRRCPADFPLRTPPNRQKR